MPEESLITGGNMPNVRGLRCSYDRIVIASAAYPGRLWKKLPIPALRGVSHSFNISEIVKSPFYHSRITLVGVPGDRRGLEILQANEEALLGYTVTVAEVAADALAESENQAVVRHIEAIVTIGKRRCVRGELKIAFDDAEPPEGIVKGPTIYSEHARSSVAFKSYCRYDKAPAKQFTTQHVMRWEWSLKGSAIKRHLGGNQLADLLNANLQAFVAKNLVQERVNYVELGKLLAPDSCLRQARRLIVAADDRKRRGHLSDPAFWAGQAAHRILRINGYRSQQGCTRCTSAGPCGKHEIESLAWQRSPTQIRGHLKGLNRGSHKRRRGRPRKRINRQRRPLTIYQINRCFTRLHAPEGPIIDSAHTKTATQAIENIGHTTRNSRGTGNPRL